MKKENRTLCIIYQTTSILCDLVFFWPQKKNFLHLETLSNCFYFTLYLFPCWIYYKTAASFCQHIKYVSILPFFSYKILVFNFRNQQKKNMKSFHFFVLYDPSIKFKFILTLCKISWMLSLSFDAIFFFITKIKSCWTIGAVKSQV